MSLSFACPKGSPCDDAAQDSSSDVGSEGSGELKTVREQKREMSSTSTSGTGRKASMGEELSIRTRPMGNLCLDEDEEIDERYKSLDEDERLERMADAVRTLLECVGEDPDREGLRETPKRMAKALLYVTKGYRQTIPEVVGGAVFQEDHSEMVIVKDINIFSTCEHHMVPFMGKVHIGYIPRSKVLGLSKLARIADMFARRLQVQERLTKQIAQAVNDAIKPLGVAVVIEATHMCMVMRGVEKPGSSTITSSVMGCFETSAATRNEFFSLIRK